MEGPVKKQSQETAVDACSSSGSTTVTVDTRMPAWTLGFEWDLTGFNVYSDETYDDEKRPPPKLVIADLPDPGVRAENDSGHVEFVSEPFNAVGRVLSDAMKDQPCCEPLKALGAQLNGIGQLLASLPHQGKHAISCTQREKGCDKIKFVFLKRAGMTVAGRPQATVGIPLSRIPELLRCEWVKADKNILEVRQNFKRVDQYPEALGFLSLVNYYYYTLDNVKPTDGDGPKQNIEALARNSFRGLYLALATADQKYVSAALDSHYNKNKASYDKPLFPKGYQTDGGAIAPELSIFYSEWIHSILDPDGGRKRFLQRLAEIKGFEGDLVADSLVRKKMDTDLLSPPPFFDPAPSDGIPYSMGRYGNVKDGLALFELREIATANLGLTQVGTLMEGIIGFLSQSAKASDASSSSPSVAVVSTDQPSSSGSSSSSDSSSGSGSGGHTKGKRYHPYSK